MLLISLIIQCDQSDRPHTYIVGQPISNDHEIGFLPPKIEFFNYTLINLYLKYNIYFFYFYRNRRMIFAFTPNIFD